MAKRKKKARKRVKVPREDGRHHVYKESGAKSPTSQVWGEHFFRTHGIVIEQDDFGRFRVPQREVLHVKPQSRKKKNSEEKT